MRSSVLWTFVDPQVAGLFSAKGSSHTAQKFLAIVFTPYLPIKVRAFLFLGVSSWASAAAATPTADCRVTDDYGHTSAAHPKAPARSGAARAERARPKATASASMLSS